MANKYVVYKGELLYGEEIGEGIAVDIRADGSMSISQCIYEGEQEEVVLPKESVERLLNLLIISQPPYNEPEVRARVVCLKCDWERIVWGPLVRIRNI